MTDAVNPAKYLKAATQAEHTKIEGVLKVMSDDFSLEEYKALLRRFYDFYRVFEKDMLSLEALRQIGLDYSTRLKAPLLKADLLSLGFSNDELNQPSEFVAWKDNPSVPELLGMLYVVEGSTLGGQVISRHLGSKFSVSADNGSAFFSSYGQQIGPMWTSFQSTLNSNLQNSEHLEQSADAAKSTFSNLGKWLAN